MGLTGLMGLMGWMGRIQKRSTCKHLFLHLPLTIPTLLNLKVNEINQGLLTRRIACTGIKARTARMLLFMDEVEIPDEGVVWYDVLNNWI